MFVIFLVWPTSPRNSLYSKKIFILYLVLFFFFGFLAFDPRWILWCLQRKEVSPQDCLLIPKVSYQTVYPEKLFPWPPVFLLASDKVVSRLLHLREVLNFFLCFRSEFATEVDNWTIRLDCKRRMFTFVTHFWENKIWQQKKLFLSLTHIDFAVSVSSRAVRVFPVLSLRRVRPSYGTFSLMVFQGNCVRGRTGHMINFVICFSD